MSLESTSNPGEAGHMQIWNEGTQRYEGYSFDPKSDSDREFLDREKTKAERRGGFHGSPPVLYKKTHQKDIDPNAQYYEDL